MTTEKKITLKEAYESVGETIQRGDLLRGADEVLYVDGWSYALSEDPVILYRAAKIQHEVTDLISRNGKQIYPKVEEVTSLPYSLPYSRQYSRQWGELVKFYAVKQHMDIMHAQELANLLFDYVCGIITHNEKMGE